MNRTAHLHVAVILCFALMSACSKAPSDGKIESQVVAALTQGGADKLYDIENFHKTNGLQKDDKTYEAQVHYEVVFKKAIENFTKNIDANPSQSAGTSAVAYMVLGKALAQGAKVEPGGRVSMDETITLQKTDNGWQISRE
jgi:hypothetical protein